MIRRAILSLFLASACFAQQAYEPALQNAVLFNQGGGPPAWQPTDLGSALVAWYDASDAATVHTSGSAVTQWDDKSGNGFHLVQGTSGNRPTYSATGFQGNTPGITFDGSNDFLSAASVTIGTNKCSAFCFAQLNHFAFAINVLGYQANGDAGPFSTHSSILFQQNSAVDTYLNSRWTGTDRAFVHQTSTAFLPSAYLWETGFYRMGTIYDGTNNTVYLDNAYVSSAVAASTSLNTPGTLLLGARSDGSQAFQGVVTDVIIVNRDVTSDERAKIDSFLMRHWSRVVVTDGDSLVALYDVTAPRYPQLFPANSNPAAFVADIAIAGTDFWTSSPYDCIERVAAVDARLPTNKGGRKYIYYFTFTNNLNGSPYYDPLAPQTVSSILAGYITYANARKAAGWDKVVISTVLSRTDSMANDTFRNSFNSTITNPSWAGLVANGGPIDAICNMAADPIMGVDAAPTVNAAYFQDQVHPNNAGFARLEVIFRAAINGL